MHALVTGGQGFVGSHLCARLVAQGHRVRVLARPSSDLGNLAGVDVEVVRGDVTQPASLPSAVAGCDVIFHVAGALKGLREQDLFRVNADGTRNLLAAAAGARPRPSRFVYVSSVAAAGPSPGGSAPRTEEMPLQPLTWYGHSKLAGENAVRADAQASIGPSSAPRSSSALASATCSAIFASRAAASCRWSGSPTATTR